MLALKRKVTFKSIGANFREPAETSNLLTDDGEFRSTYVLTLDQSRLDQEDGHVFTPFTQMERMDLTQISHVTDAPKVVIQTFNGAEDCVNLQHSLEVMRPDFVVMYHSDVTAVREIEVRIEFFLSIIFSFLILI